jgi:hypothetical protein
VIVDDDCSSSHSLMVTPSEFVYEGAATLRASGQTLRTRAQSHCADGPQWERRIRS